MVTRTPKSKNKYAVCLWLEEIRKEIGHCEFYGTKKQYKNCNNQPELTHHIDKNHNNNVRENILVLCDSCHKSFHHKGKSISIVVRQKISKSVKDNHPRYWKGKQRSIETRQKISESIKKNPTRYWKGKHLPKEVRQKIGSKLKGRTLSDKTRQKISESSKRMWKRRKFQERLKQAVQEIRKRRKNNV